MSCDGVVTPFRPAQHIWGGGGGNCSEHVCHNKSGIAHRGNNQVEAPTGTPKLGILTVQSCTAAEEYAGQRDHAGASGVTDLCAGGTGLYCRFVLGWATCTAGATPTWISSHTMC